MKKNSFWLGTLLVPVFLGATAALAAPAPESFAPLAARLKPSVVNISTSKVLRGGQPGPKGPGFEGRNERFREFFGDEFFRRFFGDQQAPQREFKSRSLGSGFIVGKEGYILTNNHVVANADDVVVRLSDEHEFKAKVVGFDERTDLALIQIDPKGLELTPVDLADSDQTKVGDWVMAIGNPFGYGHTITVGIVSAKERVIGSGPYDSFLQTDAAINPGNSGGPLFDLNGRVVGISTAIVAGGTGIGFAIPANMARSVVDQLRKDGKVTRGWLGVMIQEVTAELAKPLGLDDLKGALVTDVPKGGPADKAGIKRKDVILEFGGTAVDKMNQLPRLVASRAPGTEVTVVVLRDGAKKTLNVALGELKGDGSTGEAGAEEQLGLTVQEITPELRNHLELESDSGLVVSGVEDGSPAEEAGLKRGDVILEVNQQEVSDVAAYRKALGEAKVKESTLFLVRRGSGTLFVVVKKGK